jgi:sortase (surface protein transpeptidase)
MGLTGRHAGARLRLANRRAVIAVAAGLVLATAGTAGALAASHSGYVPPRPPPVHYVLPPVGHPQTPSPQAAARQSPPVSLTIPVIGVRAPVIRLGLTGSGALQVPGSITVAGWYTGSPPPGAVGSAIIAGHVDSVAGPGVFYRLNRLHRGDRVYVRERDGSLAVFAVGSVRQYRKSVFPTLRVYGPTPTPQLRLITCGGTFDPQTRHYLSNVVVYATLVS